MSNLRVYARAARVPLPAYNFHTFSPTKLLLRPRPRHCHCCGVNMGAVRELPPHASGLSPTPLHARGRQPC
eukprot:365114-Chlamydomonas_euryale.AAC.1